ncbi:MAG: prolipoprotein diacylglyceryl transferase [Myxococcales bacterium]|nr:prolipoprotein diacylglyceryl transferase [Myxococcales bacterium]
MWPVLFEIPTSQGTLPMNTYGLFIALAFSAAFLYVHLRVQKVGIMPDRMLGAYIAAFAGGLLGARLLYVVAVDPVGFLTNPLGSCAGGGFAFFGGLIGGIGAVGAYVWYQGMNVLKVADIAFPSVALAYAIGRMGCLSAGCCFGAVAPEVEGAIPLLGSFSGGQIWLSSSFPFVTTEFASGIGNVAQLHDVPLYPSQLWSITGGLLLAALLTWAWSRRRFDGQIMALYFMIEGPIRFLIEGFRADHRGYVVQFPVNETVASWLPGMTQAGGDTSASIMGLTTSQGIGLLWLMLGAGLYIGLRNRGVAPEEALNDEMEDDLLLEA